MGRITPETVKAKREWKKEQLNYEEAFAKALKSERIEAMSAEVASLRREVDCIIERDVPDPSDESLSVWEMSRKARELDAEKYSIVLSMVATEGARRDAEKKKYETLKESQAS